MKLAPTAVTKADAITILSIFSITTLILIHNIMLYYDNNWDLKFLCKNNKTTNTTHHTFSIINSKKPLK